MLDSLLGQEVVVDLASPFVCMGTLTGVDDVFLELHDADLHDLRDTHSSRENYVAAALRTGIKRNRRRVLICRREIAAIGAVKDVVDE